MDRLGGMRLVAGNRGTARVGASARAGAGAFSATGAHDASEAQFPIMADRSQCPEPGVERVAVTASPD